MKVLFIGLGSIGLRHARLLPTIAHAPLELFALRSGAGQSPTPPSIGTLDSWDAVDRHRFDLAFICNPTSMHIPIALRCAERGMHLFIEKPIAHDLAGLDELRSTVRNRGLTAYVAYPLRFHPAVVAFREKLRAETAAGHVRCVVSSHLPSWRPGTPHLESYSARRELGGGVVLDLSHELDLLAHLFGSVEMRAGLAARLSDVTIDAEDFADAILRAGPHVASLHMNFFSVHPQRTIELDLPGRYLRLDLMASEIVTRGVDAASLTVEKFPLERDTMYEAQLRYFLDNLANPSLMNNLDEASQLFEKVLRFRDAALHAAR